MIRKIVSLALAVVLSTAVTASAARIFDGYAGVKWGTSFHKVMKSYPKGKLGEFNKEMVYKQVKPNKTLSQRTFAFDKDGKLKAVSITFDAAYVKKTGLENLAQKHIKSYGAGKMDRSGAPHMITYIWDAPKTKVTFAYAPKRPEMTVMMFEKKLK